MLDDKNPKLQTLRILQILPSLVSGGVERGTVDLSSYLVAKGHEVWVCSSGGPMVSALEQSGARHILLPVNSKNPFIVWLNSRRLIRLQKQYHFDLIHVRSRAPAWSVLWARKQLNIPLFSSFHGQYGHNGKLKRFYNAVMLKTDVCIAVSDFIKAHIQICYPDYRCTLKLIRRGIDLNMFTYNETLNENMSRLKGQWQIRDKQTLIILPGRLTRLKGHLVFLEAIARLTGDHSLGLSPDNLRCLIVGDEPGKDEYRKQLQAYINTHQLGDFVAFTGNCYDMPAMYALADIVISASTKPEAFGRTACEAQAMNCLVVATEHGGSLETIAPVQRQFMCKQGSSESMAEAIQRALEMLQPENKARLEMISLEAKNYIHENFSLGRMCRETEQLYLTRLRPQTGLSSANTEDSEERTQ